MYGTAPVSMTTEPEECSISDLPSLIEEEKVEEKLKEDREDETKSEIEVCSCGKKGLNSGPNVLQLTLLA